MLGAEVISLRASVPRIGLTSRGSSILSIDDGGAPFVEIVLEKEDVEVIRKARMVDPEARWSIADVGLRGLKLEVSEGVVSDVSRFVSDISGVKTVGQDLGAITMSLYRVARLNTKPEEATAKPGRIDRAVQMMKEKSSKVEGPLQHVQKRVQVFETGRFDETNKTSKESLDKSVSMDRDR